MRRIFPMLLMVVICAAPVFAEEEKESMSGHEMMMGMEKTDTPEMEGEGYDMPMKMGGGMGMCGMMGAKPGMGGGMGMMGMGPGMGQGMGMMGGGMGMAYDSPRYQARMKKFMDDTVDLRRELHAKMFDYREALRHEDAKDEDIEKLEKEVYGLQEQIQEKAPLFMKHRGMMKGGMMGW